MYREIYYTNSTDQLLVTIIPGSFCGGFFNILEGGNIEIPIRLPGAYLTFALGYAHNQPNNFKPVTLVRFDPTDPYGQVYAPKHRQTDVFQNVISDHFQIPVEVSEYSLILPQEAGFPKPKVAYLRLVVSVSSESL